MNWKTDPNLLAKKILERIESTCLPDGTPGEISYTDLEKIATDKNIDLNIFDAAVGSLHRFKKVTQRTKGDDIWYKAVPKKKKERKPARQCLVEVTNKKSPFYGAMVYPLDEFKREGKVLYRYGAVTTPGYGENRAWFCPSDFGLPNDDLPIPAASDANFEMPFPEINLSYIFLRPKEMLEFKAQMKGMPAYMMKRIHQ